MDDVSIETIEEYAYHLIEVETQLDHIFRDLDHSIIQIGRLNYDLLYSTCECIQKLLHDSYELIQLVDKLKDTLFQICENLELCIPAPVIFDISPNYTEQRRVVSEVLRSGRLVEKSNKDNVITGEDNEPALDIFGDSGDEPIQVLDGKLAGGIQHCRVCDNPLACGANFCSFCGSKVAIDKSDIEMKKVQFSAVAPKTFIKGDYTVINIVMYENSFRHVVDELLNEAENPVQETKSGVLKVHDGAKVRIVLSSPDIEIDDNEEIQNWQGDYLNFSFVVVLPKQYKKRQILFNANVYVDDVIATKLKFIVKCSSFCEQKISVSRDDVLSAFVSYASQDRTRVAAIIQGMKKARPDLDVFFDVDSLRSGEDWERTLHYEIEKRDILFLCWSHFARQSKWVDEEWRYALAHKGIECIEPVPIEPPGVCPPPDELKSKHFNDKLLYIINVESRK